MGPPKRRDFTRGCGRGGGRNPRAGKLFTPRRNASQQRSAETRCIHRKFMSDCGVPARAQSEGQKAIAGQGFGSIRRLWLRGGLEAEAQTDLHDAPVTLNGSKV